MRVMSIHELIEDYLAEGKSRKEAVALAREELATRKANQRRSAALHASYELEYRKPRLVQ